MPKVSVIIPSYNHAAFIGEAVNSVLTQTEADLELVVVDDGSQDQSLEILHGFSDPRLRIISQSNQGAHAAINRGLRESFGKILAILNSDDAYDPQRLEKAIAALNADPSIGLVGSTIEIMNDQGQSMGIKHGYQDCPPWLLDKPERSFRAGMDLRAALLTENYWSTSSNFVFTRDWFEKAGEFRPLRYTHDWDFALRLAQISCLCLIPEPLIRYRVHKNNTIRENQAAMVFEICWCLAVNLPAQIGDAQFFNSIALETRVDQLLNSIYVFGCERVLSVMLLQKLHENRCLAIDLLEPSNPARRMYVEFIENTLLHQTRVDAMNHPPLWSRGWKKFKRLIKS